MKETRPTIKTKRLCIYPLSDEETAALIESTEDAELKAAYTEMLECSRADPENRLWYVPWVMELKKEKTRLGELGFKGPAQNEAVELGFGIRKEFEGQGYTTEAAQQLVDWAFQTEGVFFVEAEAAADNAASLRVLEKLGFEKYSEGIEGPRFVRERQGTSWLAIYMCFGISIGMSFGHFLGDNLSLGMCIGVAMGVAIGASLDSKAKKRLEEARARRSERLGE